jgi:hypothetical protein
MPEGISIPQWIQDECVRHKGQFVLRVFSIGGDKPIKCNAELAYQVCHLTGAKDSPVEAAEDLRERIIKACDDDAKVWRPSE